MSAPCLRLPACIGNRKVNILIDSGSQAVACIGTELAQMLGLVLNRLQAPRSLRGFDDSEAAVNFTTTASVAMSVHREVIDLFVVDQLRYEVILGMP